MDLIDKGIKGRREYRHLHRYLHAASEPREQRPARGSAVSAQTVAPETGGPVAASSSASACESPAALREVAATTITFRGTTIVHQAGSAETHALLKGLGSLIPAERRASDWVIEIVPEGEFFTYALSVPLRKMSNPAASLARVPVAHEGVSK
jgi:hypothetical protein